MNWTPWRPNPESTEREQAADEALAHVTERWTLIRAISERADAVAAITEREIRANNFTATVKDALSPHRESHP